jgi:large subunit ribosomal protein L18
MDNKNDKRKLRKKRSNLVRGTQQRPRVVINKSNRYLMVQAIDDEAGNTLFSASTTDFVKEGNNGYSRKSKNFAEKLGEVFAEKLKTGSKEKVVFDRNGYLYHGKIKTFCDTMRQLGIKF